MLGISFNIHHDIYFPPLPLGSIIIMQLLLCYCALHRFPNSSSFTCVFSPFFATILSHDCCTLHWPCIFISVPYAVSHVSATHSTPATSAYLDSFRLVWGGPSVLPHLPLSPPSVAFSSLASAVQSHAHGHIVINQFHQLFFLVRADMLSSTLRSFISYKCFISYCTHV